MSPVPLSGAVIVDGDLDDLYEFSRFTLDPREGLLVRDGRPIPLTPKVLDTLVLLVRNAGHLMDREELLRSLWPDTVVTEANLTHNISVLRKALGDSESDPRFIETVPRRGYRFLAAVTRVRPGEPQASWKSQHGKGSGEGRRRLTVLVTSLLVLIALVVGGTRPDKGLTRAGGASVKPRTSVAVLGFKNLSGRAEDAWLSTALSEMLSIELAAGEKLRTIPGESVARLKSDLALADAEVLAADSLTHVRASLATDFVVLGSFVVLETDGGGKIRFDVRIQDCVGGDVLAAVTESGHREEMFDLVSSVGARLREKLGVGVLSAAEIARLQASFPSNTEASRLYAAGLEKLRLFDTLAARDLFAKAVGADPEYALAHSALAATWASLGYDERAKEEAKRAFDRSRKLARQDGLLVEARYRQAMGQGERAVAILQALRTFFPDDLEHGLRLAEAQTAAGRGKEALLTVAALRSLPPLSAADPRIDLVEAEAALAQSDSQQAAAAARRAAAKGAELDARLLVARARLLEATALQNLGEPGQAAATYELARKTFAAAGDRAGVADAARGVGIVLLRQGDLVGARKRFEDSLAVSKEIGRKLGVTRALNAIGAVLTQQGDHATAEQMFRESLAVSREVGDLHGSAMALGNLAIRRHQQGDYDGARALFEEALATHRQIGGKYAVLVTLHNLATLAAEQEDLAGARSKFGESLRIAREVGDKTHAALAVAGLGLVLHSQGDLSAARRAFEEALALARAIESKSVAADALADMSELHLAQGDFAAARKASEEALAIRQELGEQEGVANSRLDLAGILIEEGRPGEAQALARQAVEEFRRAGVLGREAVAHEVLARACLAGGDRANAEREVRRAQALLEKAGNRLNRLRVAITAARVKAISDRAKDAAAAVEDLSAVLAAAAGSGNLVLLLEARLALGEIELRSGQPSAGHTRLASLEADAKAKGFGLLVRKAAGARSRSSLKAQIAESAPSGRQRAPQ